MKKVRLSLAVAAVAVALTAGLSPAASAQNIWNEIGNVNCVELEIALKHSSLIGNNTTRSELAAVLRMGDPTGVFASRVANRAADCGIVKDDSNLSSQLSSGSS